MQNRAIRSLCYTLVLALLSTIAPTPFTKPASAQLVPQYSVGVVDFINESGVQGDLLARLATDSVVVEMSKSSRFDVSITRTLMKTKMDELGLRAPMSKVDLIRLGEALTADAMLEGVIKSVQLAGSGPTRRASVSLVVQMVDEASGEVINGAVQTGTSSARVGYTADDNSLIAEAVNSAAFLAVKTMADYVIPEATVMVNVGESQVMINKGARNGIKPGMRMIVLRDKEIIGYIDVTSADPDDAYARVIKSMRGIQPQDRARAIFEMPVVASSLKSAPLPSGAPSTSRMGGGAAGKIGKFLLGAAVVFGLVSLFQGGTGTPDGPTAKSGATNLQIKWEPTLYNHGQNVYELQIIRDQDAGDLGAYPVRAIRDNGQWNSGVTDLKNLYGNSSATAVSFNQMDIGATTPTVVSWNVPSEGYGNTHRYNLRALLRTQSTDTAGKVTYAYSFTKFGSVFTGTAVAPVKATSSNALQYISSPQNGDTLLISRLSSGDANLTWAIDTSSPTGADQYRVVVQPVQPGTAPSFTSGIIYYGSGTEMSLSPADRTTLAGLLTGTSYADKEMKWRVDCRNSEDTATQVYGDTDIRSWTQGSWSIFTIGREPDGPIH